MLCFSRAVAHSKFVCSPTVRWIHTSLSTCGDTPLDQPEASFNSATLCSLKFVARGLTCVQARTPTAGVKQEGGWGGFSQRRFADIVVGHTRSLGRKRGARDDVRAMSAYPTPTL